MGEHKCYKKYEGEHIKKEAYELWDRDGRKRGRDLDYWLKAEKTIKAQIQR